MRTDTEISERQKLFIKSYRFPKADIFPKMKAWTAAINASVRTRGYRVYSVNRELRKEAVIFWKIELERLGEKYRQSVQSKGQFIEDVYALQRSINESDYHRCFANERIRIGQCQKSLSIFLKWMWCQDQLAGIPPVCPIDGIILSECRRLLKCHNEGTEQELADTRTAWSNLDCPEVYERLVAITEKVARLEGEPRPCVWELFAFREPLR